MPQAIIEINAVAASNNDLPINTLVQLSNDDAGDESTYLWSIVSQPPGAADALSSTTIENPTITPEKEDTYLIKLIVDQGLPGEATDIKLFRIRRLKTNNALIATEETTQGPQNAWSLPQNETLSSYDDRIFGGDIVVAQAAGSLTAGTTVAFDAVNIIKAGLPGAENVPRVSSINATDATIITKALGVVISKPDGSTTIIANDMVLVRMSGLLDITQTGTPAVGDNVFVSDGGVPALIPGTNQRLIGAVVDPTAGAWKVFLNTDQRRDSTVTGKNIIHVNSADDFPAAVAGVRTLEDGKTYLTHGFINVGSDRFVVGLNSAIIGTNFFQDTVLSTTTSALFTGVDNNLTLFDCTFVYGGPLLAVANTVATVGVGINRCVFSGPSLGTVGNVAFFAFENSNFLDGTTSGITFTGTNGRLIIFSSGVAVSAAAPVIDLGSSVWALITPSHSNLASNNAGGSVISGLANNGNLVASTGRATLLGMFFTGTGTPLVNITVDDTQWDFNGVSPLADTASKGLVHVQGNATETVIASVNVPVRTAATWTADLERRFTINTNGVVTYIGLSPITVTIFTRATVNNVGGGTDTLSLYLGLNTVAIAGTAASSAITSAGNISTGWVLTLATNDTIEQMVENNTDTSNIVVVDSLITITD